MGIKDGSGLEKSGAALKNECRPVFLFPKKWKPSANGCKPNSVIAQGKPEATDIHLSAPPKPTTPPFGTRHTRCSLSDEQPCIIHCLAPSRVFHTRGDCSRGGGLLPPPFHPCPKAVCFLRHFSYARVFPERSDFSIGALLCGVRTFLSPKSRQANVRRLRKAFKELMWLGDMVAFTKTPMRVPAVGVFPSVIFLEN